MKIGLTKLRRDHPQIAAAPSRRVCYKKWLCCEKYFNARGGCLRFPLGSDTEGLCCKKLVLVYNLISLLTYSFPGFT
jgi:hypothetical protein